MRETGVIRRSIWLALLALIAITSLVACELRFGTLTVRVEAYAADGSTYRFPARTRMRLTRHGGGSGTLRLDLPLPTVRGPLPIGTYDVELAFPKGRTELVRTLDGVESRHDATWTNASPTVVTIDHRKNTNLTLSFSIGGVCDIVFSADELHVCLSVEAGGTTDLAGRAMFNGAREAISQTFGSDVSDELRAALSNPAGSIDVHGLGLQLTSGWQPTSIDEICVDAELTAASVETDSGYSRTLRGAISATGTLCIADEGATDRLQLTLSRTGPPSAEEIDVMPDAEYQFGVTINGEIANVYDGDTLLQSELDVDRELNEAFVDTAIHTATGQLVMESSGDFDGTIRLAP